MIPGFQLLSGGQTKLEYSDSLEICYASCVDPCAAVDFDTKLKR